MECQRFGDGGTESGLGVGWNPASSSEEGAVSTSDRSGPASVLVAGGSFARDPQVAAGPYLQLMNEASRKDSALNRPASTITPEYYIHILAVRGFRLQTASH